MGYPESSIGCISFIGSISTNEFVHCIVYSSSIFHQSKIIQFGSTKYNIIKHFGRAQYNTIKQLSKFSRLRIHKAIMVNFFVDQCQHEQAKKSLANC